jgi:hypothetical protein
MSMQDLPTPDYFRGTWVSDDDVFEEIGIAVHSDYIIK